MRLPRMTTRRWMALVAVVGVILTGIHLRRLRSEYLVLSAYCAAKEEISRAHAGWNHASIHRLAISANSGEQLRVARKSWATEERRVEYFAGLKAKYARAAERPWLPVPPDPPEPQ
jgi:hypothetical protein